MKCMYAIRIVGRPNSRRYIIQRNDHLFWTGKGWSEHPSGGLLYRLLGDAQRDCVRFQRDLVEGLPRKEFSCTFTVTVVGENAACVTTEDVAEYLSRVLQIGLDYEVVAEGPVADAYVECQVRLGTLKEVKAHKRGR